MQAVIFGWGNYGRALKRGLEKYYGIEVIAICDNDEGKWGATEDGVPIIAPKQLPEIFFEKIFICIRKGELFKSVEKQLLEMKISKDKVVVMQMSVEYQDAFIELDSARKNWIRDFADYTREIGLKGNVAECGVYRGETAMFINKYWSDRLLYLCDTFEGFSEKDIGNESNNFLEFKNGPHKCNPFRNETPEMLIENVKRRMLYPDNVKIYQGYFPECARNIVDKFCFVNLDMDLCQPQLEGLRFFWNKMEIGGVILLHDYFHPDLPGVKAAVTDFEKELGIVLPKVPIGDNCSIAVIKHG